MFSSRWCIEDVPGISSTFGRRLSSHDSPTWGWGDTSRRGRGRDNLRAADDGVVRREGRAEREERHEGDAAGIALVEHRHGGPVREVQRILHAGDVCDRERVQQVVAGDIAESDPANQPVVSRLHHGGELVIEPLVRLLASSIRRSLTAASWPTARVRRWSSIPRLELGRLVVPQLLRPIRPGARRPCSPARDPQG